VLQCVAVCCSVLDVCVCVQRGNGKDHRVCLCLCCADMYVSQYVAVCCSMLQCVAVCCVHVLGLKRVEERLSSLSVLMLRRCECVAVCCSMLQYVAVCCMYVYGFKEDMGKIIESVCAGVVQMCVCCIYVLHLCVAVRCGVLQCVAVCCSVLHCMYELGLRKDYRVYLCWFCAGVYVLHVCVAVCYGALQCVVLCCSMGAV